MNAKQVQDVLDRVDEYLKLMDNLIQEQFEGMGPGLTPIDDETFYALFLMRMSEYGPDFARALDAKKPDGLDLIPGGRNQLRRFMRIEQRKQLEAMAMWEPEPYEEVSDA